MIFYQFVQLLILKCEFERRDRKILVVFTHFASEISFLVFLNWMTKKKKWLFVKCESNTESLKYHICEWYRSKMSSFFCDLIKFMLFSPCEKVIKGSFRVVRIGLLLIVNFSVVRNFFILVWETVAGCQN